MLQPHPDNFCNRLTGKPAGAFAPAQGEAGASVPALVAGVRPASQRAATVLKWLWTALLLICLAPLQAVSANNLIINSATLHTSEASPSTSSAIAVLQSGRTKSTIEFLTYAPGVAGATAIPVQKTWYQTTTPGNFTELQPPKLLGSTSPIDISASVPLLPTKVLHAGEPAFIRVTDLDQNLDKNVAETIIVTVSDPVTGDSLTLRLTETGPDTGVFAGYLQTTNAASPVGNGILAVVESSQMKAQYIDTVDGSDSSTDAALVDPYGIVFDTVTGKPVDGVTIELLNATTGLPAVVLGDNGMAGNTYPNTIISGGTATDAQGKVYSFPQGGYRFPYVAAGNYILKITPTDRHIAPSTRTTAQIQTLPGAPFTILEPGSRGEAFAVPVGPAIRVDLPVDPKIGTLWLSKNAGKSIVSTGEFLSYDINIENNDPVGTLFNTVITDKLPTGFRYKKGSTRINNATVVDPQISPDGSTLTFNIGTIPPATSLILRYVTAVGAGASPGAAVNSVSAATAPAVAIKGATATVTVQEPFMQSRNIIMGRVFVGACSDNPDDNKKGMGGIGIYLEDGTFVISDKFGMFHFEGVRPGSHVVQLDLDSIPTGYKILPCEQNSRFAGRSYSQFVDMQGGTMWRTDFYLGREELTRPENSTNKEVSSAIGKGTESAPVAVVEEKKPATDKFVVYRGEISLEMISSQSDDIINYRIPLHAHTIPLKNLRLTVRLPEGATYIPGSSSFNGAAIPDPELSGSSMMYPLEDANEKWLRELQFRAKVNKKSKSGELETRAALKFDSEASKGVLTPEVTNILSIIREEKILPLPVFVFRPHFPTFGAELSDSDKLELDGLVSQLEGKLVQRIDVTGHTDNVRISPRSRGIYADNTALSMARASSVGHYLATALHLPPEALYINGSAEKQPLATNRTAAGRALNRRVEVKVSAVERIETTHLKIVKERSGIEKLDTFSAPKKLIGDQPNNLQQLQITTGTETQQSYENSTEAATQADSKLPATTEESKQNVKSAKSAEKRTQAVVAPVKSEEHIEFFSAINDGFVNYRVKLKEIKQPFKKATVTIVTPKNLLYLAGSSKLLDVATADPDTREGVITYDYPVATDERRFDLKLQAIFDGDDQSQSLSSSVTVVISDADGKNQRTFNAAAELSDNMDEINRPETFLSSAETVAAEAAKEKEQQKAMELVKEQAIEQEKAQIAIAKMEEFIEKVPAKTADAKVVAPNRGNRMAITEEDGIHSPSDGSVLATRINAVRITLRSSLTPQLILDGKEVPAERIGFSMVDRETQISLYSYIGIDFGEPGEHKLQLKGLDGFGIARFDKTANVFRAGEVTKIRLISADDNIADGRSPVKMRVQLLDKDDKPVKAYAELNVKGGDLRPQASGGITSAVANGATVSVSSEGWLSFQPVHQSGLYRTQLSYNSAVVDVETYVKPKMRDNWILVGIAEGTVGYNMVSGHMENLKAAGTVENFYDRERLAFYAKGTIKGEWLLTMAYDSAKQRTGTTGNALFQTIDPNSYYTIYGDGASQGYDATSQKNLYIKLERDQFYAMFGDFDTGLTVTELSRYSRRLNGFKSEYRSKNIEATVFGTETAQAFARDELRGDGTSGLYTLSKKGLVFNTEKITIESRDRFHSEVVTESKQLSRFVDYSIDYESGKIFFKSPVPSRDSNLNPVYIVVEYEVMNPGMNALTLGGRAAATLLDGKLKTGASYVHEGHLKGESNLYGVDANVDLGSGTKVRAEFATTTNDLGTAKNSGNAWLAEVTHTGKELSGKAYYREQDQSFGLGQQKGSETGTRKFGAEGLYSLDKQFAVGGQAYRQYTLATGAVRDFIESNVTYTDKQYTAKSGLRYANDTLADGSNQTSVQATVGGSWKTLDQKLTLRADREQSIYKNNNIDFPTRTTLGADYQLTKATTVFAQEELIYGASENINTTSIGMKSTPWSGGTLASSVVNDLRENSERTYATVGLAQKWQINKQWAADAGLDHSETLRKKVGYTLNSNVPPASGSNEDFTAVSLGANYTENKLSWSNRVEYRTSESEDKWGLITGVVNEQGLNWGWTSRLQLFHSQTNLGTSKSDADLRLGLAYRPPVTKWIVLDRLDLIASDEKTAAGTSHGRRIVNNLNANYKRDKKMQMSVQYGAKYVFEQIDAMDYSGYTDLIGLEGRYDITKHWDISARGTMLHTWESNQYATSYGPSVGYNIMENAWISVGYNIKGYYDRDFSMSNWTTEGPYVQFRFKFDQNSIKEGLKIINQ